MAPRTEIGMPLSALLDGITDIPTEKDLLIDDIALDSRDVGPGSCFLALRGSRENGLSYAIEAITRGAVVVLAEDAVGTQTFRVPVFERIPIRENLGLIAKRFFGDPSVGLKVFAITGTNGKSTVAHIVAQALDGLGRSCGYIGTLGAGRLDSLVPLGVTTPDPISLNRWLSNLVGDRVENVALEASSHALVQNRLTGVAVNTAVFTNLGHDHLDYHGNTKAYADSKRLLFGYSGLAAAVINIDDSLGASIARTLGADIELWSCATAKRSRPMEVQARVTAANVESSMDGLSFTLTTAEEEGRVQSRILGRFNAENLLLSGALLLSLGFTVEQVCTSLSKVSSIPGRMQYCGTTRRGVRVFLDYAHSPDSMIAVLTSLREFLPRSLTMVFGCGGDRDRDKRPIMGGIAETHADRVILTSDNPRGENNANITREIISGIADSSAVVIEHDRASAIELAIGGADTGDIVLVAGKGHETFQEHGNTRTPFSDYAVIASLLKGVE